MSQENPSRKKAPALDPDSERALKGLVEFLTRPDEARHREAVAWVLQVAHPTVLNLIVERLIQVVRAGGETSRPAESLLAELGEVAVPVLCDDQVYRPRTAVATQVRLILLLGRMSSKLPLRKLMLTMTALQIVENRTRHQAVADAARWALLGLDEPAGSCGACAGLSPDQEVREAEGVGG